MQGGNLYNVEPYTLQGIASFAYKLPEKRMKIFHGFLYQYDFSDYDNAVYFNPKINIVIMSCRGTDPTSFSDLYNDLIISIKDTPSQRRIDFAILLFKKIFQKFNDGETKFIVTGHSLGSNIATQVYKWAEENLLSGDDDDKIGVVVFNRGTTPFAKLFDNSKTQDDRYHHHIHGDVLSFGFLNDRSFNHFVYPTASYVNPVKNHVLSTFSRYRLKE